MHRGPSAGFGRRLGSRRSGNELLTCWGENRIVRGHALTVHEAMCGETQGTAQLRQRWETSFTSGASAAGESTGSAPPRGSGQHSAAGSSPSLRRREEPVRVSVFLVCTQDESSRRQRGLRPPGTRAGGTDGATEALWRLRLAGRHRWRRPVGARRGRDECFGARNGRKATEQQEGNGRSDAVRLLARGILRRV